MAAQQLDNVVAHWHKLIENFQTTSVGFYASVEDALERRQVPGLRTRQVIHNEGGVLSPRREYLRVVGEQHLIDICAAPFGNGFFFSSWVATRRARFVWAYLVLLGLMTLALWAMLQWTLGSVARSAGGIWGFLLGIGIANPLILIPFSFLIVLAIVSLWARAGTIEPELAVLETPLLGWFYGALFKPDTYYRLDTLLMFQSTVHSAVLEVVDSLLVTKGLRALSGSDRAPVFRELLSGTPASDQRAYAEDGKSMDNTRHERETVLAGSVGS